MKLHAPDFWLLTCRVNIKKITLWGFYYPGQKKSLKQPRLKIIKFLYFEVNDYLHTLFFMINWVFFFTRVHLDVSWQKLKRKKFKIWILKILLELYTFIIRLEIFEKLMWHWCDFLTTSVPFVGQLRSTRPERITDNSVAFLPFYCISQILLGYKLLWVLNFAGIKFHAYCISKTSLALSCGCQSEKNIIPNSDN